MRYLVIIFFILFSFNSFSSGKHNHDHDHKNEKKVKHKHDHDKHDHGKKESLSAHEHGLSKMNIVQDHHKLLIEIEMPGHDVVGFEYKAKTNEDKNKVKQALMLLKNPINVIKIPIKAKCDLKDSHSHIIAEKNHTEFRAEYSFVCKDIDEVKTIGINIFENFKNSEKIDLNVVGEKSSSNIIIKKSMKKVRLNNFSH